MAQPPRRTASQKRSWDAELIVDEAGGSGLTPPPSQPASGSGRASGPTAGKKQGAKEEPSEPGMVFRCMVPFSMSHIQSEGQSFLAKAKEDAARFGCTITWRAARRVPLKSEGESVPYMVTVRGRDGAAVLRDFRDEIYANWPLETPPPPPDDVQWELPDGDVYSFTKLGQETPVDVRMFSFTGLRAARAQKPGGITGRRIKSQVPIQPVVKARQT